MTRYFQVTGILGLVVLGAALAAGTFGNELVLSTLSNNPWGPVLGAIQGVSNLLVGQAVWRRKRSGAIMALATFIPPLALSAFGQPGALPSLVVSAIGLIATISIWSELSSSNS